MLWLIALGTMSVAVSGSGQSPGEPAESATVVLSPRLVQPRGPGLARGEGWRALWTEPVRLPVAQADQIHGGLTAFAVEPGTLVHVVTARGADDTAYRLLPADRDPVSSSLSATLRGSMVEDVLRDLVATVHPTAPLIAAALYQSAGLDAISPALVIFRADPSYLLAPLINRPVWIERAPDLDGKAYGRFVRVITTKTLLDQRRRDPTLAIASERYLAVRLLDILIGDRNRRPEHWLWGLDSTAGQDGIWVPIATRQEEAFLRAQGWSAMVLNRYEPGHQVFDPSMPDVGGLTDRGYDLDRVLLVRLDRPTWDSVATALAQVLTTERIQAAAATLPASHRTASDSVIVTGIVGRRSALPRIVDQYFRLMNQYPDVELSDASERVAIQRSDSGDIDVRVDVGSAETLQRRFHHGETKEVRVHLESGQDSVFLIGVERGGTGVRISSRSGTVTVVREGSNTRNVVLYADPGRVHQEPPSAVRLVPRATGRRTRWQRDGDLPVPRDWGISTRPLIQLGYNGDLGLVVGAGFRRVWRGFEEPQYRQRLVGTAVFASRPLGGRVTAEFERRNVLRNIHLLASGKVSGIDVVRFFGYGNETPRIGDTDFNRVEMRDVAFELAGVASARPELVFRLGPFVSFGNTDTTGTATLVALTQPYGSGQFGFAGVRAGLEYAGLRSPRDGLRLHTTLETIIAPAWFDLDRGGFGRISGEARLHWGFGTSRWLVMATRVGGMLLSGDVPFRLSARIGGIRTLTGYDTDRFAGDHGSMYGSFETRVRAFRFHVNFISGDFGVLAFSDAGRVWTRGESSSKLHTGFGGGIWAAPSLGWLPGIDNVVARLDVARGEERTILTVGTGFRF